MAIVIKQKQKQESKPAPKATPKKVESGKVELKPVFEKETKSVLEEEHNNNNHKGE